LYSTGWVSDAITSVASPVVRWVIFSPPTSSVASLAPLATDCQAAYVPAPPLALVWSIRAAYAGARPRSATSAFMTPVWPSNSPLAMFET
jgi:hypothetical protein